MLASTIICVMVCSNLDKFFPQKGDVDSLELGMTDFAMMCTSIFSFIPIMCISVKYFLQLFEQNLQQLLESG